jgi:hypothetical protein
MISILTNTFKRTLLFQFIFIFAFLKLRDITRSSYELKDRFYELATLLNFKNDLIDKAFTNSLLVFQIFLGALLSSSLLATLGSRVFSFISGLLLILLNLIYFNPLRSNNKIASIGKLTIFNLPIESLVLLAISLGIFIQTFSRDNKSNISPEAGAKFSELKRETKPNSSNKKKKAI